MSDAGNINEAENLLLEEIDAGSKEVYRTALSFYDHINDYDDEFLLQHNFSREEIRQGLIYISEHTGYASLVDALLDNEKAGGT